MAKQQNPIVNLEIRGIDEVSAKMDQMVEDLTGSELVEGVRDASLLVTRDARILAPVDTGRLRSSIAPEVTVQGRKVRGVVGSNVVYAPYQEDKRHYLENAFAQNVDRIKEIIGDFVSKIVRK